MVFHPALFTHRQDTCQARLRESERSSVEEEQAPKTGFSWSGKELRVRKIGEGKGKTIHMKLFGLLSDRFLGSLHGFNLMDSRFHSTTVLYSVLPGTILKVAKLDYFHFIIFIIYLCITNDNIAELPHLVYLLSLVG